MTFAESDDILDEEWVSASRPGSRMRVVLAIGLVAALAFLGGVLVQKQFGTEETAAATSPFGEGLPQGGGLPEGLTLPGDGSQGQTDAPDDQSDAETVIGTLVRRSGSVWVVEDLGGTRHRIAVSDQVRVTQESQVSIKDVATGSTVNVTGDATDSDTLNATEITVR